MLLTLANVIWANLTYTMSDQTFKCVVCASFLLFLSALRMGISHTRNASSLWIPEWENIQNRADMQHEHKVSVCYMKTSARGLLFYASKLPHIAGFTTSGLYYLQRVVSFIRPQQSLMPTNWYVLFRTLLINWIRQVSSMGDLSVYSVVREDMSSERVEGSGEGPLTQSVRSWKNP